jgi:hypothetical protein
MVGQFGLRFRLPHKSQGSFTCRKCATWDRRLYFPSPLVSCIGKIKSRSKRVCDSYRVPRGGYNAQIWVKIQSIWRFVYTTDTNLWKFEQQFRTWNMRKLISGNLTGCGESPYHILFVRPRTAPVSFVRPSVRLPARVRTAPLRRISVTSYTVEPWFTNSICSRGLVVTQVGRKSRLFFPKRNNGNTHNAFRISQSTPYLTFT